MDPVVKVVQEVTAFSVPAVASVSAVLPTTKRGGLLHVWTFCAAASAVSVTDNDHESYGTALDNVVGGALRLAQFRTENVKGGPVTVTAHFAANSQGGIWVAEINDAATPTALDGHTGRPQITPGLGANAVTSGPASSSNKPVLVIGLSVDIVNGLKLNAGTGFTSTTTGWDAGGGNLARSEYRRVDHLGDHIATFTALANDTFITMVANYDEAAPPTLAWVTQTNSGLQPFAASRIDGTQTLQVGNFESAALAMAAVNQQLSRVLRWSQDVRLDGVLSYTGR